MPARTTFLIVAATLLLIACSASGGASGVPASAEPTAPAPTASAAPVGPSPSLSLVTPGPSKDVAGARLYVGVLGNDTVEGGCPYLQTVDGSRYEVLYPDGWELQRSPPELRAPDGTVVARVGDPLSIRAVPADDMVSICQIGQILRAVEVVLPG